MERKEHEVQVDKALLIDGENTFICSYCNEAITLVWNGEKFEAMPDVAIVWKGYA